MPKARALLRQVSGGTPIPATGPNTRGSSVSDLRQLKNLEGLFTFDLEQDNLAAVNAPYSQKLDAQAFAYCLMSLAPAKATLGTDVLCLSAKSR